MNAHAHSLLMPAELPLGQEAEPRVVPADEPLEVAWERWGADLERLAAALGIGRERRDDVLQDVYLAARKGCPAGLAGDALRRWLFRVTANRCRLEHRRRKRWGKVFATLSFWPAEAASADSAAGAERNELTARVEAALGKLTGVEREIIVLRYFGDFDSREIGELLSLPGSTVRSKLAHARKQLARDLAEWRYERKP